MAINRLNQSSSPYLQQHRDNPVHWWEWCSEAFDHAEKTRKPILLSVGYSACHWCHVMAHESFENPQIAAVMNERFVSIKVDREERPDIDSIYMAALHAMGEQGGWPLTMFLTPDLRPFWGGTYFPPEPRFGRPGFVQVLEAVSDAVSARNPDVERNADALTEAIGSQSARSGSQLTAHELDKVAKAMLDMSDPTHGGLRGAPKFPNAGYLEILLRAAHRTGDSSYREGIALALTTICKGGITDQVGGGFCRYSVDERWLVPHFEKMLYDNAQLVAILAYARQLTNRPLFDHYIAEAISWLDREMRIGHFYAASLDADSEGVEGKYYLWSPSAVAEVLEDRASNFCSAYDITDQGNFEGESIPNLLAMSDGFASESAEKFRAERAALLFEREKRIPPGRDDKAMTDWNALMVEALAIAGFTCNRPEWLERAEDLLGAIETRHYHAETGDLLHTSLAGKGATRGLASDYANMINATVTVAGMTGHRRWYDLAVRLADEFVRRFVDKNDMVFMTEEGMADLIVRPSALNDEAVPGAAGSVARGLFRLSVLTGDVAYGDRSASIIDCAADPARKNAFATASIWNALDTAVNQVTVGFELPNGMTVSQSQFYDVVRKRMAPHVQVVRLPSATGAGDKAHHLFGTTKGDAVERVHVCRGNTCFPSVDDADALARLLDGT